MLPLERRSVHVMLVTNFIRTCQSFFVGLRHLELSKRSTHPILVEKVLEFACFWCFRRGGRSRCIIADAVEPTSSSKPEDRVFWRIVDWSVLSSFCYIEFLNEVLMSMECMSNAKLVLLTRTEMLDTSGSLVFVWKRLEAAQGTDNIRAEVVHFSKIEEWCNEEGHPDDGVYVVLWR